MTTAIFVILVIFFVLRDIALGAALAPFVVAVGFGVHALINMPLAPRAPRRR